MNEKLIKVRIERDFWAKNNAGETIRHRAGTEIEVPVEAALEGIETGALSRLKVADKK